MIRVFGIVLSLVLSMYLAYRGINVLILAPLFSLLAVLISDIFMVAVAFPALATLTVITLGTTFGSF